MTENRPKIRYVLALVIALFLTVETAYGTVINAELGKRGPSVSTEHGFSAQTEKIVEAHMDDFNYETFDSFMESKGGAENYVRSLGGVFTKWCGVQGNVQTAEEFREVAEYVMGVMAIWGPDYHGGSGDHEVHESWGEEDGGFYPEYSDRGWKIAPLEEVYFQNKERIVTDCGSGAYYILQKAGLMTQEKYAGTARVETAKEKVDASRGGTVIYDVKDLQTGDLIQMSKTEDEADWGHVCIVAEVLTDGTVVTYDTGTRFVERAYCKCIFSINPDGSIRGDYSKYKSWFGMRIRALKQDQ